MNKELISEDSLPGYQQKAFEILESVKDFSDAGEISRLFDTDAFRNQKNGSINPNYHPKIMARLDSFSKNSWQNLTQQIRLSIPEFSEYAWQLFSQNEKFNQLSDENKINIVESYLIGHFTRIGVNVQKEKTNLILFNEQLITKNAEKFRNFSENLKNFTNQYCSQKINYEERVCKILKSSEVQGTFNKLGESQSTLSRVFAQGESYPIINPYLRDFIDYEASKLDFKEFVLNLDKYYFTFYMLGNFILCNERQELKNIFREAVNTTDKNLMNELLTKFNNGNSLENELITSFAIAHLTEMYEKYLGKVFDEEDKIILNSAFTLIINNSSNQEKLDKYLEKNSSIASLFKNQKNTLNRLLDKDNERRSDLYFFSVNKLSKESNKIILRKLKKLTVNLYECNFSNFGNIEKAEADKMRQRLDLLIKNINFNLNKSENINSLELKKHQAQYLIITNSLAINLLKNKINSVTASKKEALTNFENKLSEHNTKLQEAISEDESFIGLEVELATEFDTIKNLYNQNRQILSEHSNFFYYILDFFKLHIKTSSEKAASFAIDEKDYLSTVLRGG